MDLEKYRHSFLKLLQGIEVERVCEGDYPKTYLKHLLGSKEYYVSIYAAVLTKVLEKIEKTEWPICLVDYGCGNGLLGLFARHCGFSPVIFQDTDQEFLNAAKKLSHHFNLDDVYFIPGEIDSLKSHTFRVGAVVGTDVIEHIYDLDKFFNSIRFLNPGMVTVFSTAANPFNPLLVARLKNLHRRDELEGYDGSLGGLAGHGHQPYLEIRRQLILERFPLQQNIDDLTRATRGLAGVDIETAVKKYQLTNRLPVPKHPTNTCNPVTGSWTERILTATQYRDIYSRYGFELDLNKGFYNSKKKGFECC